MEAVLSPAGVALPSDPLRGEPLFGGAAGGHGQTPPQHSGQKTARQAAERPAAEGAAVS